MQFFYLNWWLIYTLPEFFSISNGTSGIGKLGTYFHSLQPSAAAFRGERVSLRNIPGLKLILIALVWALSTTLLPIVNCTTTLSVTTLWMLLTQRILFFMAIAIPFDVRDIYQDSIYSLKTIAVALGKQKSQYVAHLSLALSSATWWYLSDYSTKYVLPIIVVWGVAAWCIQTADKQKELFYFIVLDGLLFLAPALLAIRVIA